MLRKRSRLEQHSQERPGPEAADIAELAVTQFIQPGGIVLQIEAQTEASAELVGVRQRDTHPDAGFIA